MSRDVCDTLVGVLSISRLKLYKASRGFTIVELLIVIVVIAILAAIVVVSYTGISNRAKEAALKSDLEGGAKQLQRTKIESGSYPGDTNGLKKASSTTFTYTYSGNSFCLTAVSSQLPGKSFYVTEAGAIQEGTCPPAMAQNGDFMQTVTAANCPSTRTRVVDARDNHSYWIRKLTDGKCWMLTNIGYAGGGVNTYGDSKTLTEGSSNSMSNFEPRYYLISGTTNYTTEPSNPSSSTDGTGQYGYAYNWCGAMGGQSTDACGLGSAPDITLSVCPAGWRLPSGGAGGEVSALNVAVNGGSTTSVTGLLTTWLAQYGGMWNSGMTGQGGYARYWSGTQESSNNAYSLYLNSSSVSPATMAVGKAFGQTVRCVVN